MFECSFNYSETKKRIKSKRATIILHMPSADTDFINRLSVFIKDQIIVRNKIIMILDTCQNLM